MIDDTEQYDTGQDMPEVSQNTIPSQGWSTQSNTLIGGREYVPGSSTDPLDYWRANHNDPAYKQLAEIQAKAKFDAQNFEQRYTSRQRAEISRLKTARQSIDLNPNFSDAEKIAAKKSMDMQILGVKPADLPKLSPYPPGMGIGDNWKDPNSGAIVGRKPDGGTHVLVRPDQTTDAKFAAAKLALDNAQIKHQQKQIDDKGKYDAQRESEILKHRIKLADDDMAVATGVDATGKPNAWRRRNSTEIDEIMRAATGGGQQAQPQSSAFDAYYNSLPSGATYQAPNGQWKKKK